MTEHDLRDVALLRRVEVEKLTGLGKTTIYRRMGAGSFPRPVRIDGKGGPVRWRAADVRRWLESRGTGGRDETVRDHPGLRTLTKINLSSLAVCGLFGFYAAQRGTGGHDCRQVRGGVAGIG